MASFDYSTLFALPRPQVFECYRHLFQSLSSRVWLAKDLENVHMDDCVEFFEDLRHVYLDKVINGPMVDYMVTFPANSPELTRREYTIQVFMLCCLCLGRICLFLPTMGLNYPMRGVENANLSSANEPLQGYLFCGDFSNTF